jgi:hypothetical protein
MEITPRSSTRPIRHASVGPDAGIAGVASDDAGAASGLVNVAHQLGGSLGLGVLVTVFAAASFGTLAPREALAHRIGTSLTAGTAMLAFALVLVAALIVGLRTAPEADPRARASA